MIRMTVMIATALAIALPSFGQGPGEPNEGLRLTHEPTVELPNRFRLSWWGISGKGYFIQQSTNLTTWSYYPVAVFGTGEIAELYFETTARPYFLRLKCIDDPLSFDSDGDGIPDWWEITYSLDPHLATDASGNVDGDSLSNLEEYRLGTNPRQAADVLSAGVVGLNVFAP